MFTIPQRWALAATTTLALLAPASSFFAGAPAATAVRRASSVSFHGSSTSVASIKRHDHVTGPLFMSADVAVDQKGLATVYFKETCPYCKKALALLEDDYSLNVVRVNVLEGEDSDKKIKQMKTFSGRTTVPQIFFNSEHIGGNDDLQKLHEEGKLGDMVSKLREEEPGMMKDSWYHPWY